MSSAEKFSQLALNVKTISHGNKFRMDVYIYVLILDGLSYGKTYSSRVYNVKKPNKYPQTLTPKEPSNTDILIFFYISEKKKPWHFMWIVCHVKTYFLWKTKRN